MKVPKWQKSKESEDFSMYNYGQYDQFDRDTVNQVYSMQTAQFYAFKEVYSIVGQAIAMFAKVFNK
jgi:hypothetical protein